jgi:N-acetylmuramoyl-L-alanine amidase
VKYKIALAAFLVAVTVLTAARGVRYHAARRASAEIRRTPLTLIVDPGHGGEDGGAVSENGLVESGVNLDIAKRVDALAAFFGVRTVMTRESEAIEYSANASTTRMRKTEDQHARLALIRASDSAVFLSIHQNQYPKPGPFGAQVLYAGTPGSAEFGNTMQTALTGALNPSNRRAASRIEDNIFLMNHIDCPAVLVECAFLSNPTEEALLKTELYRLKLAAVITAGFLQSRAGLESIYTAQ